MSQSAEATAQQPLETQLVFSEPLLRRVVRCYLWRRWAVPYVAVSILVVASILFSAPYATDIFLTGWLGGATLLLMAAIMAAVYFALRRQIVGTFRKLDRAPAPFRVDDSTFTIVSSLSSQTFAWSLAKEVWQFPDFWLLLFNRNNFITLPTACLSDEMKALIVNRITAAGGKIR